MAFGHDVTTILSRLGQPNNDVTKFCFEEAIGRIKGKNSYKLLLTLSLFTTDASREALGNISDLSVLDRDDSLVELEMLSLVNVKEGQFSLLPLTKTYAAGELANNPKLGNRLRLAFIKYFDRSEQKTSAGLSANLYNRLRSTLLECQEFDSNARLRSVFVTKELAPLQNSLPETDSRVALVDGIIAYLLRTLVSAN